jgi:hypothetical protein
MKYPIRENHTIKGFSLVELSGKINPYPSFVVMFVRTYILPMSGGFLLFKFAS